MSRVIAILFALLFTFDAQAQNGLNSTTCTLSAALNCLRAPVWATPPTITSTVDYLTQTPFGGLRVQLQDGAGHDIVSGSLTYSDASSGSVGTASGTLVTAGAYLRTLTMCTLPTSSANVWLRPDGGTAAPGTGLPIYAGGGCITFGTQGLPMPTAAITAITDGVSAQTVTLAGG